ncbi:MAG: hypothetical protein GWN62_35740, partial [Aliifodinibius sp.]|nr:hypothetical protein [Fodinibius sp.]
MTRHGKKILFTALAFMIVYPAISLLLAIFFTQPYKKSIGTPPNDWNFPIEEVAFATSDSLRLNGWYLPTEQEEKAIVLLHGYRCTRRQMISRAGLFRENGFSVLLYDARGCGESEGERV